MFFSRENMDRCIALDVKRLAAGLATQHGQ